MIARWSAEIAKRRERGSLLEFTVKDFAKAVGTSLPNEELELFLQGEAESGVLMPLLAYLCPFRACALSPDQAAHGECADCDRNFIEESLQAIKEIRYRITGQLSRDIRWIIIVHGMNSRAAWQEDFTWMVANKFRYSVPILVYKYGWITIDVLVKWRHLQLARALGERIRKATAYAKETGLPERPDIIAHSFGSRLFTLVLADSEFGDLKFGRIITAGSIVAPDFKWEEYISTGRIEAVLNHAAGKDTAVPLAQFFIPGAGPGGRVGYIDKLTKNVKTPSFKHSSCLTEEALERNLIADGVWDRFLRRPVAEFSAEEQFSPGSWKPANRLLKAAGRFVGILIFIVLTPLSVMRRLLDK